VTEHRPDDTAISHATDFGSSRILLEQGVSIPLHDETVTIADIWRNPSGEPMPAILVRTPYGRSVEVPTMLIDPRRAVPRGFAVVAQDVRGRGDSKGEFQPYLQEARDGYASVEWVARQAWCTGDVFMAGASYVGATQWLTAVTAPPSLRAIAPAFTGDRYDEGWTYRGGVLELAFIATWLAGTLAAPEDRWLDDVERAYTDRKGLVELVPFAADWFSQPTGSTFWESIAIGPRRAMIRVPILSIGGWYDIFLDGTLRNHAAGADRRSRLIVGPWGHEETLSHILGDRNVGFAGSGEAYALFDRTLAFFQAIIDGNDPQLPLVAAYILGRRSWMATESWPPPGARVVQLPLTAGSFEADGDAPPPSLGGRALRVGAAGGTGFGVRDQRELLGRPDVLALDVVVPTPILLAGPVVARLVASAEGAAQCDWACTLCVEATDGRLDNLCEGIVRVPASTPRVDIPLGDICVELPLGARLTLLVAGASFPRWEPLAGRSPRRVLRESMLEITIAP
jgi:putative CocE/NonD family hydrolase